MERVFLLLGTNLGNRLNNLETASTKIESMAGKIVASSSVYRTAAWGKKDQPDFYNQVIELSTELSPFVLLSTILQIERTMGRERKERWGERLIDIDILIYGSEIILTEGLRVPHPELQNRRFSLVPLSELAEDFIEPISRKTIGELLKLCADPLAVEPLN